MLLGSLYLAQHLVQFGRLLYLGLFSHQFVVMVVSFNKIWLELKKRFCQINKNIFLVLCEKISLVQIVVYYVTRHIMRVITRRATILAGDRSQGVAEAKPRRSRDKAETNPRRDQSCEHCRESRNFPNCVHWHIFYFMWFRCGYEFSCVHSNPIWKGRNCRDYRPSHLTFRKYFRPLWLSRFCVVTAYCNRRMRSSNVQGSVSKVSTVYEEEEKQKDDYARLYRNRQMYQLHVPFM